MLICSADGEWKDWSSGCSADEGEETCSQAVYCSADEGLETGSQALQLMRVERLWFSGSSADESLETGSQTLQLMRV